MRYEFSIGFYVDAPNEREAFLIATTLQELVNKVDAEGDSALEFHGPFKEVNKEWTDVHSD